MKKSKTPGVMAKPLNNNNIMLWEAIIHGPDGTAWEGGVFELRIAFGEEYPIQAPLVTFMTHMFHPNIYADGKICLDILQKRWSPSYTITAVLTSIQSLLSDPNPDSPANPTASNLFEDDLEAYHAKVRECVEKSWVYRGTDAMLAEEDKKKKRRRL
jgi:ubiquitin-conjugating enzyme E2 A